MSSPHLCLAGAAQEPRRSPARKGVAWAWEVLQIRVGREGAPRPMCPCRTTFVESPRTLTFATWPRSTPLPALSCISEAGPPGGVSWHGGLFHRGTQGRGKGAAGTQITTLAPLQHPGTRLSRGAAHPSQNPSQSSGHRAGDVPVHCNGSLTHASFTCAFQPCFLWTEKPTDQHHCCLRTTGLGTSCWPYLCCVDHATAHKHPGHPEGASCLVSVLLGTGPWQGWYPPQHRVTAL